MQEVLATHVCKCGCHTSGAIHFDACCHGKCNGCGEFVAFGYLIEHDATCEKWHELRRRSKRKSRPKITMIGGGE